MIQNTKKAIVFLILIAVANICLSSNKPINYPNDTLQQFVKNYGKDSITKLIDVNIKSTAKFIETNIASLSNNFTAMELNLFSKHFKLKLDTLDFSNKISSYSFYKLYDNFYGDTSSMIKNFEEIRKTKQDIYTLFVKNMATDFGRIGFASYCNYFTIPDKALDTLYHYGLTLDENNKLQTFWALTEFSKNCGQTNPISKKYTSKFFNKIYTTCNLKDAMDKTENYKLGYSPITEEELNLINALKLTAYGLYANEITEIKNSTDLMYLLKLQKNTEAGWENNIIKQDAYPESAIYLLWALCEFREKLVMETK